MNGASLKPNVSSAAAPKGCAKLKGQNTTQETHTQHLKSGPAHILNLNKYNILPRGKFKFGLRVLFLLSVQKTTAIIQNYLNQH